MAVYRGTKYCPIQCDTDDDGAYSTYASSPHCDVSNAVISIYLFFNYWITQNSSPVFQNYTRIIEVNSQ